MFIIPSETWVSLLESGSMRYLAYRTQQAISNDDEEDDKSSLTANAYAAAMASASTTASLQTQAATNYNNLAYFLSNYYSTYQGNYSAAYGLGGYSPYGWYSDGAGGSGGVTSAVSGYFSSDSQSSPFGSVSSFSQAVSSAIGSVVAAAMGIGFEAGVSFGLTAGVPGMLGMIAGLVGDYATESALSESMWGGYKQGWAGLFSAIAALKDVDFTMGWYETGYVGWATNPYAAGQVGGLAMGYQGDTDVGSSMYGGDTSNSDSDGGSVGMGDGATGTSDGAGVGGM